MKKAFVGFVCVCLIISLLTLGTIAQNTEKSYNWYCIRNKDHRQPRLDSEVSFIEEYNGYHVDKKHGDTCPEKMLYLTFDAGYENGNIEKILNTLQAENVPGAFFVLENLVMKNPDLIRRMANEGHLVCNHTAKHPDMTKCHSQEGFLEELHRLESVCEEAANVTVAPYYRPPEGRLSEENLKFANDAGYKTTFWSFGYVDWDNERQMSPDDAMDKILGGLHNGEVLLLHPTSATNAEILGPLIQELKNRGFRFGTLDELTAPESEA